MLNMDKSVPLISVIVPVYNVELYLRQCVDSILEQNLDDFELLLVDDGSTDGCGEICDGYKKLDNRVKVFHKSNGGVSSARNVGLDNACGEWVAFVDSDDIVSPSYLSGLYSLVELYSDVELVIQRVLHFKDGMTDIFENIPHQSHDNEECKVYNKSRVRNLILEQDLYLNCSVFPLLYKKSLISKACLRFFDGMSFAEDLCFLFAYLDVVNKNIVYSMDTNYFYRERINSLIQVGFGNFEGGYQIYRRIKDFFISFTEKNNCRFDDFDIAYFLHRTIMTAENQAQLRSLTSADWDFFLKNFKVFTRKTRTDRWMINHTRTHPFILLTYIKLCRSMRNFLARTNMWTILDKLKK